MTNKTYTSVVECDPNGEYFIQIPEELLIEVGWEAGDTIKWTVNDDNTVTLTKVAQ